jgi:polyketide cyclase/dehydrase/lipid transport protein
MRSPAGQRAISAREVGLGSGMAAARTHLACPTAIVNAPIDVVWGLLMNTGGWGQFYDLRVMSVEPPGPAAPGQRLIGVPGRGLLPFRITFDFTEVDPVRHRLGFDGRIPFGIMVREDMKLMEIDDARCRVNYNCDFTLPTGLRGAILRRTFGRSFDTGPADSLSRLKREAERVYARSTNDCGGSPPRGEVP